MGRPDRPREPQRKNWRNRVMSSENELFSLEAEEAVVGAVLLNQSAFTGLGLEPGDFFIQKHGFIWQAFNRLYGQQLPIDFVTVGEELERTGNLNAVGGSSYMLKVMNRTPSSLHAEAYAQTVTEL